MKLKIGTRGSALALWQAHHVADLLASLHGDALQTEVVTYKTTGDNILDRPLAEIGGKGLFTKELEVGLARREIQIAVHSLKDMPTLLPEGLTLGAVPVRADPRDCVLSRAGETLEPARVGTASLRRACLAHRRWPQAAVEPIRGNVQTRMNRLRAEGDRQVDVVILAMAGILRLKLPEQSPGVAFLPLNPEKWIPAVGQGALAIECRQDDDRTRDLLAGIHDLATATCVAAERSFLRGVEGDCRVPVGAQATLDRGRLRLRAFVGAPDGTDMYVDTAFGDDPATLGASVAARILDAGGGDVLRRVRGDGP